MSACCSPFRSPHHLDRDGVDDSAYALKGFQAIGRRPLGIRQRVQVPRDARLQRVVISKHRSHGGGGGGGGGGHHGARLNGGGVSIGRVLVASRVRSDGEYEEE